VSDWAEDRRWQRLFDGVGPIPPDGEDEADPDEITDDWAEPDQQEETQDMTTYSQDEVIALVKKAEAEATAKAKAEAAGQQTGPELTPEEALAQVEALRGRDQMYVQDGHGNAIFDPEYYRKALDIARKAGVRINDRRGRPQ
jgi:hypothetical protein